MCPSSRPGPLIHSPSFNSHTSESHVSSEPVSQTRIISEPVSQTREVSDSVSIMPSSSLQTVLERAQHAASLSLDVENPLKSFLPIPSVDSDPESLSHPVNMGDIDDEMPESWIDSLTAEGIEEDNMDDFSESESEDEVSDPNEGNSIAGGTGHLHASQRKKKRAVCPYPSWFQACLDETLAQVKADRLNLSGRSRLYATGQFWFPVKSTWSILQKIQVRPTDLFIPQFFLWDPDDLKGGIGCPQCNQTLH
jgi:hypothetical protein